MLFPMLRALPLLLCAVLLPAIASAQERDEARAQALRERAEAAVSEGRLEEAFGHVRVAAELTEDPTVWLEVAEIADRLRMDALTVEALERYLAARPDAADRAEVEGRLRVLRAVEGGARFVPEEDGRAVRLVVDWDGEPIVTHTPRRGRGQPVNVLVDWQGRPLVVRRSSELLSLAEWDGHIRGRPRIASPELFPFPDVSGLGRRLSSPVR